MAALLDFSSDSGATQRMRRVLITCSVHYETGNATAGELLWLLGRLRPDVLFLEHSSTAFPAFLDGSCGTLESAAVLNYRNRSAVELVPVDLHLDATELKPKIDEMFDRIEEASPRYRQLELANRQQTAMGGFAYLNSLTCALLQSEMQREIRTTVDAIGDPRLAELHSLWMRTNDRRELAMITGVEAFARRGSFEKGVLLVGAGHRQQLLEKSQLLRSDGQSAVTWDFDWQLELGPEADADGGSAS